MRYFLLFLFYSLTLAGNSQQFYEQNFDGEPTFGEELIITIDSTPGNIWQVGRPSKEVFSRASTIPNAIVTDTLRPYPALNRSSFEFTAEASQFFWGVTAIQWIQKLEMDSGLAFGFIEFSIDSGASWQDAFNSPYVYNFYGFDSRNVGNWEGKKGFTGIDTNWRDIWLCFMPFSSEPFKITVRYTFESDQTGGDKDGWMMDNFEVRATLVHTVAETPQEQYLTVFPVPASDRLNISLKKMDGLHFIESMLLYDAEGRLLKSWSDLPPKFYIDTHEYASGLYQLRVITNRQSETIPVVISR